MLWCADVNCHVDIDPEPVTNNNKTMKDIQNARKGDKSIMFGNPPCLSKSSQKKNHWRTGHRLRASARLSGRCDMPATRLAFRLDR